MNFFLLVSFVATLLPYIEGHSYGENLLARLNTDIRHMDDLIGKIQDHYRDSKKVSHLALPRDYVITLRKASATIGRALRWMETVETSRRRYATQDNGWNPLSLEQDDFPLESTRRNNQDQLNWKTNFYKALSRALKNEFKDEQLIQENINEDFVPTTLLSKTGRS